MNQDNNQITNNRQPKNMNFGLIIGALVGVLAIASVVFMIMSNNDEKTDDNTNSNNKEESPIINVNEPQYENNNLYLVDDFEEKQGSIVDMVNVGTVTYFLTSDDQVYTHNTYDYQYQFTLSSNYKQVDENVMCGGDLVVKNIDNSYTVYDNQNIETTFTFTEEDLICAYIDYGTLSTFTLEDNILYYTWYEEENGQLFANKNKALIDESTAMRLSVDESLYSGKFSNVYSGDTSLIAVRDDGLTYTVVLGTYTGNKGNENGFRFNTNSNYGAIENVNSVYNTGSLIYYIGPFYTTRDKDDSIFVREGNFLSTETTQVTLPEGYKIDDIKSLNATEELLLIMNDGNVFYKEKASSTDAWENLDEFTKLTKNNHILKVANTSLKIFILCDDGYLYELH